MPEYPEKNTTQSSGDKNYYKTKDPIPVVHSISSSWLTGNNWLPYDKGKWIKDGIIISYNGLNFKIGEIKFQFTEQLNDYLSTGKIPEE